MMMKALLTSTLLAAAVFSGVVLADPPERIYIACDDHTDYLWTADAAAYRQAFLETLDYYLARADATEKEPDDSQARFNCDGSMSRQAAMFGSVSAVLTRVLGRGGSTSRTIRNSASTR